MRGNYYKIQVTERAEKETLRHFFNVVGDVNTSPYRKLSTLEVSNGSK